MTGVAGQPGTRRAATSPTPSPSGRGPVDRRLLRYAAAARGYLLATVALGLVGTLLILAQARALLADPAVLILDEPTAHLDPESRAALTADLLTLTTGRTTLLITHELEGLGLVDEIVILDHGKVAQRGTHEQLMRASGPCRQLQEALSFWPVKA